MVDNHLHLQNPALHAEIDGVLARAARSGVTHFCSNGTSENDWDILRALARRHPTVCASFGLHPWYVSQRGPEWLARLSRLLDELPSAIGEIGLDHWITPRDEAAQEHVFRQQLALARNRQLPVSVHCLRAWDRLLRLLADEPPLPRAFLLHAYGGSAELLAPLAKHGAYFSFATNLLDPRKDKARAALKAVPLDRLLLESDAPDMLPPAVTGALTIADSSGKRHNQPANLPLLLDEAARLRGMRRDELAGALDANARRFWGPLLRENT